VVAAVGLVGGLGWVVVNWAVHSRKVVEVMTAAAARGDLVITVTERGELESSKSTQVMCEVEGGGKLATIVPEGKHVKKGDEIAKFDTDALTKSISEQEVKWETAEGKKNSWVSETEVQRSKGDGEVAKARNALELAQIAHESYVGGEYKVEVEKRTAALDLAKKDMKEAEDGFTFTQSMVRKGFTPLAQLQSVELNLDSKRATVRQQEADLMVLKQFTKRKQETELRGKLDDARREKERAEKSLKASVEKCESEVSAARKTAELEKKQLERLRAQLEKCVVKAPQDGIVIYAKRYYWDDASEIRPGATLNFQQPIVVLPDLNRMQVKMRVHESVVKRVKPGQSATLQVEALGGQVLHGKVVSVATQAQAQGWRSTVKEYETVISVDDLPADAGLRPGMSAEVKVLLKTIPGALAVPVSAVTEFDGKQVAYVQTPAGIERREVKVGDTNDQLVQVVEGLEDGERVALDARARAAAELKTTGENKDQQKDKDKAAKETPSK
jgi:RND family efflux transporter MFP subunit